MTKSISRTSISSDSRRLCAETRGSAAILFGVTALPVLALVGASIDYARYTTTRAQAQSAADAAVLAAGSQIGATQTQSDRQNAAIAAARGVFGAKADALSLSVVENDVSSNTWQVTVSGSLNTVFGKFLGKSAVNFLTTARATNSGATAARPIEIALALDNTGSMSNNMADLKAAAKTLVQSVMGGGSNVRVSVVPYVAAVNPGLTDSTSVANYIDTTAVNPWNGAWHRGAWQTSNSGCLPYWGPPSGGGGSGGAGSGGTGDARDILEILNPIRRMAQELFGVTPAHADATPATAPYSTTTWTSPVTGLTYTIPAGFNTVDRDHWGQYSTGGCEWLANPDVVSQYDLFRRIKDQNGQTVQWKGCVEARLGRTEQSWLNSNWGSSYAASTDYDLTDEPPGTADSASLFVPYFWPDEPDYSPWTWAFVAPGAYSASTQGFHNNYLPDGTIPTTWGWKQLNQGDWDGGRRILKYDGTTRANIVETPDAQGFTYGPNAGCPDPVLRLTRNQGAVTAKIDGLAYWQSGGTIISEGLMWAWRTLSPKAPYADGAAYNAPGVSKVIVLMTDGVNELIDNGNNATSFHTANVSDYSAYGYGGGVRLNSAYGLTSYDGFNSLMNSRLLTACANAKAAGVQIYTVVFNHTGYLTSQQQADAQNVLRSCASSPSNSFVANDTSSLTTAFNAIGVSAVGTGALRLIQ
jgi:Flp pilus assembly protein TadG